MRFPCWYVRKQQAQNRRVWWETYCLTLGQVLAVIDSCQILPTETGQQKIRN